MHIIYRKDIPPVKASTPCWETTTLGSAFCQNVIQLKALKGDRYRNWKCLNRYTFQLSTAASKVTLCTGNRLFRYTSGVKTFSHRMSFILFCTVHGPVFVLERNLFPVYGFPIDTMEYLYVCIHLLVTKSDLCQKLDFFHYLCIISYKKSIGRTATQTRPNIISIINSH